VAVQKTAFSSWAPSPQRGGWGALHAPRRWRGRLRFVHMERPASRAQCVRTSVCGTAPLRRGLHGRMGVGAVARLTRPGASVCSPVARPGGMVIAGPVCTRRRLLLGEPGAWRQRRAPFRRRTPFGFRPATRAYG
jgi:hypothetical protein